MASETLTPAQIVGKNIARIRAECGISQEELAERANLHRTYVSGVERGLKNISVTNIFALALALRCDASELLALPSHCSIVMPVKGDEE